MGLFSELWNDEAPPEDAEPEGYSLEVLLSGWVTLPGPLEPGFGVSAGEVLDQPAAR